MALFKDFVSGMRLKRDRTSDLPCSTNQFMTGFSNELEKTNLRLEEWSHCVQKES